MTKSDLVDRLSKNLPGITLSLSRTLIDLFLDAMKEGLAEGDTVEFRDFGVLRVHQRAPLCGDALGSSEAGKKGRTASISVLPCISHSWASGRR
ncbi:MAG: HU family DNA-binding protein [Leptospirales bacterium]